MSMVWKTWFIYVAEDEVFPTLGTNDSAEKKVEGNGRVDDSTNIEESKKSNETREETCDNKRKQPEKTSEKKVCENHPQGVVLVRFKDRKDARKCIEVMNGRWFGGRQVHASEDDGSVNHALVRDWDEEAERLEKFGVELEYED